MQQIIPMNKQNFTAVHALVDNATVDGTLALRVIKGEEKLNLYDENTYAEEMKHGTGAKGNIGIFVDIDTEAFVSELKVTCTD